MYSKFNDWQDLISPAGWRLLSAVGYYASDLTGRFNPVTTILKQGAGQVWLEHKDFSLAALSRLATVCQMLVYDAQGGPDGDDEPKALRRHWYAWYKVDFAQPLSRLLTQPLSSLVGQDIQGNRWGRNWSGRLSETYAWLVDRTGVDYRDLWVKDASRMMSVFHEELWPRSNIILCVEKDSLFDDFVAAARAIGAKALISGKGKSSKAAMEKLLRDARLYPARELWQEGDGLVQLEPIDYDHPLMFIHISDYDYDGEAVIGPTFAEQATRYTKHIYEARAGIEPHAVQATGNDLADKVYRVKRSNKAYKTWASDKGLYSGNCYVCGESFVHLNSCPSCATLWPQVDGDEPHGLEVEAIATRDYYGYIVDALLEMIAFDDVVIRIRETTLAAPWFAAQLATDAILAKHADYSALLAEASRLEDVRRQYEDRVREDLYQVARRQEDCLDYLGDDPDESELREHVDGANRYSEPWRPFSAQERTQALGETLVEGSEEYIAAIRDESIDW